MAEKKSGKDRPEADTAGGAALRDLLALGKSKGYVTLDDVNEALDPDAVEQDDILGLLTALREDQIEVREEAGADEPVVGELEGDVEGAIKREAEVGGGIL